MHKYSLILEDGKIEELEFQESALIHGIFELDKTILVPFMRQNLIEIYKGSSTDDKFTIIYQLFSLNNELLEKILEDNLINLFKDSGYCQFTIIYQLFSLNNELLGKILEGNLINLFKDAGEWQFTIINKLFSLNNELLEKILEDNLINLFKDAGYRQFEIIDKLFSLNNELFEKILPGNLIELFETSEESIQHHIITKLFECHENNIHIPKEIMVQLINIGKTPLRYSLSKLMDKALVEEMDSKADLNPLVDSILQKTYTTISDPEDRILLSQKLADNLNKLIESDDNLERLLSEATEIPGSIFITNMDLKFERDISGLFTPINNNIYIKISDIEESIKGVVVTLVHESTHKIIKKRYNNSSLPYTIDDKEQARELSIAVEEEFVRARNLTAKLSLKELEQESHSDDKSMQDHKQKNWLAEMYLSYAAEERIVEVLPWFTQSMSEYILTGTNEDPVSKEFISKVWGYLVENFDFNKNNEIVDKMASLGIEIEDIVLETEEAVEAFEIIKESNNGPQLSWLTTPAGKLAFKIPSNISGVQSLINNLFSKPAEELGQLLQEYLIDLFANSGTLQKNNIIDKLFSLDTKVLVPILENTLIDLFSNAGKRQYIIIDKLFSLDTKVLVPILENILIDLFANSQESQYTIIDKLFSLDTKVLVPILENTLIDLFANFGTLQKNDIIDKLFSLDKEELVPILKNINLVDLFKSSGKFTGSLIDKLFSLDKEELVPILDNINLVDLFKNAGEFKSDLIQGLFSLDDEVWKPIIENNNSLIDLFENEEEFGYYLLEGLLLFDDQLLVEIAELRLHDSFANSGNWQDRIIEQLLELNVKELIPLPSESYMLDGECSTNCVISYFLPVKDSLSGKKISSWDTTNAQLWIG